MFPKLQQKRRERVLRRRVAGDPLKSLVDVAGHRSRVERASECNRRFPVGVGVGYPPEHRSPAVAPRREDVKIPNRAGERPGDVGAPRRRAPPEVPAPRVDDTAVDPAADDGADCDGGCHNRPSRETWVRRERPGYAGDAAEPSENGVCGRLENARREHRTERDDTSEAQPGEQPRGGVNAGDVDVKRDRHVRAAVDAAVAFVAPGVRTAREQRVRQAVGDAERAGRRRGGSPIQVGVCPGATDRVRVRVRR